MIGKEPNSIVSTLVLVTPSYWHKKTKETSTALFKRKKERKHNLHV
jgi:hypothetical protein